MKIERTFTIDEKSEWHTLFGEEATKWFGKNCYWIAWKFKRTQIERAFDICVKKKDHDFSHFLQLIHSG